MPVALVGVVRHVDGVRQRRAEAHEALAVLALLGEIVKPRLGFLDLLLRREVDRRVVGRVDHVLAEHDQRAAHGKVVDRAAVVLGVDDGRGVGGEPAEVLRHGEIGVDRLGGSKNVLSVIGVACLPAWIILAAVSKISPCSGSKKCVGSRNAVTRSMRLVVDEDRAEQRLLGLDIVGGFTEGRAASTARSGVADVGEECGVVPWAGS